MDHHRLVLVDKAAMEAGAIEDFLRKENFKVSLKNKMYL
jgi:hypothetical protein